MKRIVITLFTLLLLTACQRSSLEKIGYSVSDISLIKKLTPAHQALFENSLNNELLNVLHLDNFKEEKIDKYVLFKDYFSGQQLMDIVTSDTTIGIKDTVLKGILEDKYFIYESLYEYIEVAQNDTKLTSREVVEKVNTLRNKKEYEDIIPTDTTKETLMIVNKYHYFDEKYEPKDLTTFDMKYCDTAIQSATKEVHDQFIKMYDDALSEGITILVNSGYRSYSLQKTSYNNFLRNDSKEVVDTYSARPGFSEHQTGLALDILSPGYNFDNFQDSDAFKWLSDNAYKYGFILRYQENKQNITGYKYEPWHYRYLGEDVAKDVKDAGITYDEYYTCKIEK